MLLGGITTVCDAYFCMDSAAKAYDQAGMRAVVCRDFLEAWQRRSPLVILGLLAHAAYTCSPETLRERYGANPVQHLVNLGILESMSAGVHGVWLDVEEAEFLARAGVGVRACLEAEMKLASGTCDVTVGLGTDGVASNNDFSLIGERCTTSRMAKLDTLNPTALSASTTLNLALTGSARCLGLEDRMRSLQPGRRRALRAGGRPPSDG